MATDERAKGQEGVSSNVRPVFPRTDIASKIDHGSGPRGRGLDVVDDDPTRACRRLMRHTK